MPTLNADTADDRNKVFKRGGGRRTPREFKAKKGKNLTDGRGVIFKSQLIG